MGTAPESPRFTRMGARGLQVRLLFQVAILAATVVAVVPPPSSAKTPRPAAHHRSRHRLARREALLPLRLRLPAADDFSADWGGDKDVAIASPRSVDDGPRTAIDYQLTRGGPVGSFGLLRAGDTQAVPPATDGPAASLRRGYPEVTAGANLRYPF